MTLIAKFSVNGVPLLVGDVLVSSDAITGRETTLPLVGDINKVIADHGLRFEVGFKQKVNLIGERLAVAWSGPMMQAERALRALSAISTRNNPTSDDIRRALEAIDNEAIDRLCLIGLLHRDTVGTDVEVHHFAMGIQPIEQAGLGRVFAAGTGRAAFLALLQKSDWTNSGSGNHYQVAHALLGGLTNEEYRTGRTIMDRWGGGFEAITFQEGRFEKIGDVLHTFWRLNQTSNDPIGLLPMFYKTAYLRDALIVRSARFDEVGMRTFALTSTDLVLVPPLLMNVSDYDERELDPVDFTYRAICCHVLLERPENRDLILYIEQSERDRHMALEIDSSSAVLRSLPCICGKD